MEKNTAARIGPREFFHYLGILVALYVSAPTLVTLLWSVIDVAFPRVERYYGSYTPSISWPVAILIIIVPIYVALSWMLQKQLVENPARRDVWMRKWFIYITLFLTGIAIVVDLITVLYYFLDGQIVNAGFYLKVLSVLIVAGLVFMYYITDLRNKLTLPKRRIYVAIAFILLIGSIILGFSVLGSPRTQRLIRYDQMKVNDLQSLQSYIVNYWQQKQKLPENLAELDDPISSYMVPTDAQTGAAYEYQKTGNNSFKLCAEFNRGSEESQPHFSRGMTSSIAYPYPYGINEKWDHTAGKVCFDRTIDPQLYPPFPDRVKPL